MNKRRFLKILFGKVINMRAFIHAFAGEPWNEECRAAKNGFSQLGIECILFSSNEELDQRKPEDVVVGGMLIMSHVLNERNIITDNYNYPDSIKGYCGRKIWTIRLSELEKQPFPIFIKPVEEKRAKGIVLHNIGDLSDEYQQLSPETEILCSEALVFQSEWRCFVRYNEILGIRCYAGDSSKTCDMSIVAKAVHECKELPAGCSLDFGLTDEGRTVLIEMNDGFALGCYGLNDELYAKLLSARWAELNGTIDALADR